jgi:hypothetical protein
VIRTWEGRFPRYKKLRTREGYLDSLSVGEGGWKGKDNGEKVTVESRRKCCKSDIGTYWKSSDQHLPFRSPTLPYLICPPISLPLRASRSRRTNRHTVIPHLVTSPPLRPSSYLPTYLRYCTSPVRRRRGTHNVQACRVARCHRHVSGVARTIAENASTRPTGREKGDFFVSTHTSSI